MARGWYLRFYDFNQPLVPVDVSGVRFYDIHDIARKNGARQGTPYFLSPSGRPDVRINGFWRSSAMWGAAQGTVRRYALSIKTWLDFLCTLGVEWDAATSEDLGAFKNWRMTDEGNPARVCAGTFRLDLAALRKLYLWAADRHAVMNPVGSHLSLAGFRKPVERLDASPSWIRRADVKWLTPQGFRQWRNIGLRGYSKSGESRESWVGRTEDRDLAYVDGLYGAGLRMAEWASVLTCEIPEPTNVGLVRLTLASACAKTRVPRPYWLSRAVLRTVRFYLDEGTRPAAVAYARERGLYEQIPCRWLVHEMSARGVLTATDHNGATRRVNVGDTPPELRVRMFFRTEGGLEPMALFLGKDGLPRPKAAWYNTFRDANRRAAKELDSGAARLWCRPHMLRHSFALRWYCIATYVAWQRTSALSEAERRDYRHQLGDVWFLLATLLGHQSAETTRQVYLEPFQALQVEQLIALMDADDRSALERLADTLGRGHPQVIDGIL